MLCGAAHRRDIDDQVVLEPSEVVRNARQGVLRTSDRQRSAQLLRGRGATLTIVTG